MYYNVKVHHHLFSEFEGNFEGVFINDNAEYLILYSIVLVEGKKSVKRFAIPLTDIESVTIKPIYEDNR